MKSQNNPSSKKNNAANVSNSNSATTTPYKPKEIQAACDELCQAIFNFDYNKTEAILNTQLGREAINHYWSVSPKYTPLHMAIERTVDPKLIRLLLSCPNIDVNQLTQTNVSELLESNSKRTPLYLTIKKANANKDWRLQVVSLLLDHKNIDVNARSFLFDNRYDETPLITAIETNSNGIVALILRHPKLQPNMLAEHRQSYPYVGVDTGADQHDALAAAIFVNSSDIVEMLLAHPEFKVNLVSQRVVSSGTSNSSALEIALSRGCYDISERLLEQNQNGKKSDVNLNKENGFSALTLICGNGKNFEKDKVLLEILLSRPDLNLTKINPIGGMPLMHLVATPQSQYLEFVLQHSSVTPHILARQQFAVNQPMVNLIEHALKFSQLENVAILIKSNKVYVPADFLAHFNKLDITKIPPSERYNECKKLLNIFVGAAKAENKNTDQMLEAIAKRNEKNETKTQMMPDEVDYQQKYQPRALTAEDMQIIYSMNLVELETAKANAAARQQKALAAAKQSQSSSNANAPQASGSNAPQASGRSSSAGGQTLFANNAAKPKEEANKRKRNKSQPSSSPGKK